MDELKGVAEYLGGEFYKDELFIRIDTGDSTSKENYDSLIDIVNDIKQMLSEFKIKDYWADHDTQEIEFELK